MNKDTFAKLVEKLDKLGYKKSNCCFSNSHSDYYMYKPFHKKDNKWEENRSCYQIILCVYDFTKFINFNGNFMDSVGIEIHYDVSRTIDERLDIIQSWHDDTTIEDVEKDAEKFYNFICETYPEPRRE